MNENPTDRIQALEEKVARLEAERDAKLKPKPIPAQEVGFDRPFPPSTYRLLDQAAVPKEITDAMAKSVTTKDVQDLVRTGNPSVLKGGG